MIVTFVYLVWMAGIRVKDPSTRLSKFELEEDDDDLDLSVPDDS